MIEKKNDIMIIDRRVKLYEADETGGISIKSVQNNLTTHLDMNIYPQMGDTIAHN